MTPEQDVNSTIWESVDEELVTEYEQRDLRPVELLLLDRYADLLAGRVLEIGVGGGRLTQELVGLARHVTGIDLAPAMVAHCRGRFPQASFHEMDLADLSALPAEGFDAVVAGYNVLDVLDHGHRWEALDGWRRVIAPEGLLIFSSHNLHHASSIPSPWRVFTRRPRTLLENVTHLPPRLANRRRMSALEQHGEQWALLNDEAHDYGLLHYYATCEETARMLSARGFELIECLDLSGRVVAPGETAARSPELHYVARRAT
jgi:SAM-dependent methyltransferase